MGGYYVFMAQVTNKTNTNNHPVGNVESDKELTHREAEQYLGVSGTTINDYVRRGLLRKKKRLVGKNRVFFLKSDLDKLMKEEVKE